MVNGGKKMTSGYIDFTILILLITGALSLQIDVKIYALSNQLKEKKAARFMGWFNIALGVAAFIGNWVYNTFFR
jgi:hypothetical protein